MGEIMELVKDFFIIVGIFVCMSLGIYFLLHSDDAKKDKQFKIQERVFKKSINNLMMF